MFQMKAMSSPPLPLRRSKLLSHSVGDGILAVTGRQLRQLPNSEQAI
jgi:hypothetical protein